jgi:hypothetical protein
MTAQAERSVCPYNLSRPVSAGYGVVGSGVLLPARVSLSHCFHACVW